MQIEEKRVGGSVEKSQKVRGEVVVAGQKKRDNARVINGLS